MSSPPYFQGGVAPQVTGWLRVGAKESVSNHPVRYASTPSLHTDVRVPRSAGMRESGLENEEGS